MTTTEGIEAAHRRASLPKRVTIFGAVYVKGKLYEDSEMADLILDGGVDTKVGQYYDGHTWIQSHTNYKKTGWFYAGDQDFSESNILIQVDSTDHVFDGRAGLREACAFLTALVLYSTVDLVTEVSVKRLVIEPTNPKR